MVQVKDITDSIEEFAPLYLQEGYDNAGLICGEYDSDVTSVLLSLDITEDVIDEAIDGNHNMIISHHPLSIKPVSNLLPDSYIKRCLIKAIKNNINIYSAHTNMDAVANGVSGKMADKLELIRRKVLRPSGKLYSLTFYTPVDYATNVRDAILSVGAGHTGKYSHCSFNGEGFGTFKALEGAHPFVGEKGGLHREDEIKTEITVPGELLNKAIKALIANHPYEEPVWNVIPLHNPNASVGFGVIGELEEEAEACQIMEQIKHAFQCKVVRHSHIHKPRIKTVALCGGSGAFLLQDAIKAGADIFISGDFKYHDFFLAENKMIIADIGHYESEQFTKEIFYELVTEKIPKFAVQFSKINTNPINYI